MIEIITRIQYPQLYTRMVNSAKETAVGDIRFSSAFNDGMPKLAESYNFLGALAKGDILLFVHDDVIFLSPGWDKKIVQAMEIGFNVVGVVGSQKYEGGMIFDSGSSYSCGKVCNIQDGKRVVKLMQHRSDLEPVAVVDGMFMAVEASHFAKTGFDWQFDGLFYYDMDFCLRSNCAVADILVSHEKPDELRGKYPEGMKPMGHYAPIFNKKHGFKGEPAIGDQRCDSIPYEDYALDVART